MHVWDEQGRKYLDLTAAFGVAAAGHANASVVKAGREQMGVLLHAMGDVHPHALKARLARELSRLTFERWSANTGKVIFCNSGFEAVESALKTARLCTGRSGVVAFQGAYHGLGYGALNVTHRAHFRDPFRNQMREFAAFAPFPSEPSQLDRSLSVVRKLLQSGKHGALLVEPIQARGGIRIPPIGFLGALRKLCDESGALLVLDEIYTGFGRTGKWFACEHEGIVPDLICLGKALTGGFPMSACVGKAQIMDAWPPSDGEAIHTSTFLGHPVGCAMALAQIGEISRSRLVAHSAKAGETLLAGLRQIDAPGPGLLCRARGRGLIAGLEFQTSEGAPATEVVIRLMKVLLRAGYIVLPEGEHSNVLGFTPPLVISVAQIHQTVRAVQAALLQLAA
jgi:4-aminobutyrate aminotransferase-like enzyme